MWLTLLTGCIPVLHSPEGAVSGDYTIPDNAWPAAESVPPLEGEGFAEGEVVEHELLPDQNGDTVDLWQFYGIVWVLDVSTIWCSPCQAMAAGLQATADKYKDDGFVYLTVLSENLDGDVPVQEELVGWSESFSILDQPITSDTTGFSVPITNGQYPALLVIDRDLTVFARVDVPDEALLQAAIESAL